MKRACLGFLGLALLLVAAIGAPVYDLSAYNIAVDIVIGVAFLILAFEKGGSI